MESSRIGCWSMQVALVLTLLLVIHSQLDKSVDAAPSVFDDYAENRVEQPSLYELLLQRELADKMDSVDAGRVGHMVVRKSDRSPSLRLRFGRSVMNSKTAK